MRSTLLALGAGLGIGLSLLTQPAGAQSSNRVLRVVPSADLSELDPVPAAVLGGLDSTTGALVGGLAVGLTATFVAGYQDQLSFLGRGFGGVAPYLVMLLVLLVRPAGLFGGKETTRV